VRWSFWRKDSSPSELDPHMLAFVMLARMGKNEFPFNKWRGAQPIPEKVDAFVAIAVNIYQLTVFLDSVERRFGSDVSGIVRSHLIAIMNKAEHGRAVESFFDAVQVGRATPEREPFWAEKPDIQVDRNVANAILCVCSESEEEKHVLYPLLAQSLTLGRISAEAGFKDLFDKIDLRPEATIGLRKPEDIPVDWSEVCGCFERHLRRRHNNPLFPSERRRITTSELIIAKARDLADLKQLEKDSTAFAEKIQNPQSQTLTFPDVYEWREEAEDLLMRTFAVGDIARQQRNFLQPLFEEIIRILLDNCPPEKREQLDKAIDGSRDYLKRFGNGFYQQLTRSGTPIEKGELVISMLGEDVETVALIASTISEEERKNIARLAVNLTETAKKEGRMVQDASLKIAALSQ